MSVPCRRPDEPELPDAPAALPRLDWQRGLVTLCDELKAKGTTQLGLQLPEGLRPLSATIIDLIEERLGPQSQVLLWTEPTYGACDLADRPLRELEVEALVHLGHTPLPYHHGSYRIPVHFVAVGHTGQLHLGGGIADHIRRTVQERMADKTDEAKLEVALVTTAQHARSLPTLRSHLEEAGLSVRIATGSRRLAFPGQLLGCNFSAAWKAGEGADCLLYLGTGRFHPLTLALGSRLPVVTLDPHSGEVGRVDGQRFLRQRHASIAKAQTAERWAVLLSPQIGQRRRRLALRVKEQLEEAQRRAYLLASTHQRPEQLTGLEVEAAVVTSCPRLAIEEGPGWPVPLLTPPELEVALGLREWDPDGSRYPFDEIL